MRADDAALLVNPAGKNAVALGSGQREKTAAAEY